LKAVSDELKSIIIYFEVVSSKLEKATKANVNFII